MVEQFEVSDVYYIHYIKHTLGKWSEINKSSYGDLGWTDNSMVTIHEMKMIFLLWKIHVSMSSRVVTGYIEVCKFVCWRFRQKLPSNCFWRVLKDCARTSFRVIIYREFAYMAFYHKFCWPQGGPTSICHRYYLLLAPGTFIILPRVPKEPVSPHSVG